MAHHQRRDRQIPKLQAILKMVFSSDKPSVPAEQEVEVVDDCDEPPDRNHLHNRPNNDQIYVKSSLVAPEKKESLLTRALLKNPEDTPMDRSCKPSYPISNASGHSTAELTSDGDLTSPTYSNTSSPPHMATLQLSPVLETSDPSESKIEADLGRKRCISFACTSRQPERPKSPEKKSQASDETQQLPRKSRLTFVCPSRQSEATPAHSRRASYHCRGDRSPPPTPRGSAADNKASDSKYKRTEVSAASAKKPGTIHMPGLGDFKPSEETRFHEFASSLDEEDGWVSQSTDHQEKITVADCMKKELAIRKLGEEAEAEAIAEEEEAEDLENDDEEEDETVNLEEDEEEEDLETIQDFSSDDGNESDNEAGFADSDDESYGNSDYEFWAPATTTAATSADNLDIVRLGLDRRNSNTSIESLKEERSSRPPSSAAGSKGKNRSGINIPRPSTPDLPDSTDFVCGTLDEDRPLEAAYMSCIEERRRKKHIPVPQDIDPSFPTTDPEDDDVVENDDDQAEDDDDEDVADAAQIEDDILRGRSKGPFKKKSARASPRRVHSPAPRAHGQVSPKRMKSPAPKARHAVAAAGLPAITIPAPQAFTSIKIACPTQRSQYPRTKSLPRTPNPFFEGLVESRLSLKQESPAVSRSREMHTRGPIDIIQGLERKRQKRKEKFWRQHCRKAAAKEQNDRRPARGKGAERMKELGLEMAERVKAYGVGQDTQLMLSV